MAVRNLIWDVDGTLFDTYPAIDASFQAAMSEFGCTVAVKVIEKLTRISMQTCADRLGALFQLDPGQILEKFSTIYRSVPFSKQPPFPGVETVCLKVLASGGINLIVTHRSRMSLENLLSYHDLKDYFSEYLSAQDRYPHKPDPAMFNALIKKFGLKQSETMAIGDRVLDIQAGNAAGLMTCGFGDHDFEAAPDIRITRLIELLPYFHSTEL